MPGLTGQQEWRCYAAAELEIDGTSRTRRRGVVRFDLAELADVRPSVR